jgi:hypothetical protein
MTNQMAKDFLSIQTESRLKLIGKMGINMAQMLIMKR